MLAFEPLAFLRDAEPASQQHEVDGRQQEVGPVRLGHQRIDRLQAHQLKRQYLHLRDVGPAIPLRTPMLLLLRPCAVWTGSHDMQHVTPELGHLSFETRSPDYPSLSFQVFMRSRGA